jgi:hypothetical protein
MQQVGKGYAQTQGGRGTEYGEREKGDERNPEKELGDGMGVWIDEVKMAIVVVRAVSVERVA